MNKLFTRFANATAKATGKSWAFILCFLTVIVWAVTGPLFGFSNTWQLVINTGTTIVTFLMVFLIQNTQNREGAAMQAKLDELIRVTTKAENEYIGIEHLTDDELDNILEQAEREAKQNIHTVRKMRKAGQEPGPRAPKSAASSTRAPSTTKATSPKAGGPKPRATGAKS